MYKKKFQSLVVAVIMFVVAITLSVSFGFTAAFAAVGSEVDEYFESNKTNVEVIDADAEVFTLMYGTAKGNGANADKAFDSMKSEVAVALKAKDLRESFVAEDYLSADAKRIDEALNTLFSALRPKDDEADYVKYYEKQDGYVKKVDDLKAELLGKYLTKQDKFLKAKTDAKKVVTDKKDLLFATTGEVNKVVGVLDATARAEVEELSNQYLSEIDSVAYTTDRTDSADTAKFNSAVQAVKELAENAESDMGGRGIDYNGVPKNEVERTLRLYKSYFNDYGDTNAVEESKKEERERRKAELIVRIKALETSFWQNASQEVLKAYSYEKSVLEKFTETSGNVVYDFDPVSVKESEDGVIKIEAVYKNGGAQAKVIPSRATVTVSNSFSSAARVNALNAIRAKNSDIGIAYFLTVRAYNGVNAFELPVADKDGNEVVYKITVDLEKYYSSCVENDIGLLGQLLEQIGIGKKKGENKLQNIIGFSDALNGKTEKNQNESVVYVYKRNLKGEAEVTPLTYKIEEGKYLMFETATFNMLAVAQNETASLFTNPLFYLIAVLALALLIVIIVIIVKNAKYSVKFYTNGGSEVATVKAKKGESIVMPENPTKKGFVFAGWYEDKELTRRFIATKITRRKGLKVYAKWAVALTPGMIEKYFGSMRAAMLAHAAFADGEKLAEGEKACLAILSASDTQIKVYLALDAKEVAAKGYAVKSVTAKEYAETPTLFVVDSKETYLKALELIALNAKENELTEETLAVPDSTDGENKYFAFVIEAAKPVATEETAEETTEATEEAPVAEAVVETETAEEATEVTKTVEETEEKPATEEELKEYYAKIRTLTMGYALEQENDKVKNGMMLVKAYLKADGVYIYLAASTEVTGLEQSAGL